jgi:hypothetical protein
MTMLHSSFFFPSDEAVIYAESLKLDPIHKPVTTLRRGIVKATIWDDVSEKGPFFSTTFSRSYKDQSGAWSTGTSFSLNDLEALLTVAQEAREWIAAAHALKR